MDQNTISTNPDALRIISECIRKYGENQIDILNTYVYSMSSLSDEITTGGFSEILADIDRTTKQLSDYHYEAILPFSRYLKSKADELEALANGSIDISSSPSPSVTATSAFPSQDIYANLVKTDRVPPAFDSSAFTNGIYKNYIVNSPIRVYRYFGAFEKPTTEEMRKKHDPNYEGWGSQAAGRWVTPIKSDDKDYIYHCLALKSEWGNDISYVAEFDLPKGTFISIGETAPQTEKRYELSGGGCQIYIHSFSDSSEDDNSFRERMLELIDQLGSIKRL